MPTEEAKIDELHALIRCLDPSERRHFSIFARRHVIGDGNHYLLLFHQMSAMEVYNAAALKHAMVAAGVRTTLTAARNHLKNLLLRSLREYRSGHDTHTRLLEGLGNLAVLEAKKQHGLLQKEIDRLKKIATLHGEHHVLFKIGDYERRLHKETARRDVLQGMEAILHRMKDQAAAFQNQMEFTHLLDRVFLLAKLGPSDREIEVSKLLSHPLLASSTQAQTLLSRIYYHQIFAIAHQLRGQNREAMGHYAAVMALWEDAPHLIRESPSTYRRILSNYLGICHLLDDYAAFPTILAQIRSTPCPQLTDRVEVFNIGYYYELLWRMGTFDWNAVAMLLPQVQQGLKDFEGLLDQGRVVAFCFNAALYHFLAQEYSACRRWLREITERPKLEQRMDLQRLARAISLLCTAALGDLDLLEHQLRAAQRHFERWGHGRVEDAVVVLAEEWLQVVKRQDLLAAVGRFLETMETDEFSNLLGAFELRAWATAQCNYTRPLDLIRELRRA